MVAVLRRERERERHNRKREIDTYHKWIHSLLGDRMSFKAARFFPSEYFYYSFIYLSVCMVWLKQGAHRFHLDRFDCSRENNIPPRYRMVCGHQYTCSRRFDINTCTDLHLGVYRSQDITKYRYTLSSIRFPQF